MSPPSLWRMRWAARSRASVGSRAGGCRRGLATRLGVGKRALDAQKDELKQLQCDVVVELFKREPKDVRSELLAKASFSSARKMRRGGSSLSAGGEDGGLGGFTDAAEVMRTLIGLPRGVTGR